MKKRGRILRDASSGLGLIGAEGQQYEFRLEGVWKSDVAPAQNMVVEFELDDANKVTSVATVNESQLAKEQADKALVAFKQKGSATFDDLSARVGKPALVATGSLFIAWFFLNTISIQVTESMKYGVTFWKILGIVNSSGGLSALQNGGGGDTGFYGFLGCIALAGPFLSQFWKDSRAHLGNCLPLLLMLFVVASVYISIQDGMNSAGNMGAMFGGADAGKFAQNMVDEMMRSVLKALHLGIGAYISIAASVYLSFIGIRKYFAAKA